MTQNQSSCLNVTIAGNAKTEFEKCNRASFRNNSFFFLLFTFLVLNDLTI